MAGYNPSIACEGTFLTPSDLPLTIQSRLSVLMVSHRPCITYTVACRVDVTYVYK